MNAKRKFDIFDIVNIVSLVVILTIGLMALSPSADATTYTKSYISISGSTSGQFPGYIYFSHTFVGRQDTVYMPMPIGKLWAHQGNYSDTLICQLDTYTLAGTDSMMVKWGWQYSDDNVNWFPTYPGIALGTDSSATGTAGLNRFFQIGVNGYNGSHPYYRITATGMTGNGKNNKAGVIIRAYPYGL